jgi:hypothetical protein
MYRHTQTGWLTIVLFLLLLIPVGAAYVTTQLWLLLLFAAFFLILLALFYSLQTAIAGDQLRVSFGIGLISRTIALGDVRTARTVRNKWYYGWGIRYLGPDGWMFNIAGLEAVELEFKSGKKFRIGTDDAAGLAAAIIARVRG